VKSLSRAASQPAEGMSQQRIDDYSRIAHESWVMRASELFPVGFIPWVLNPYEENAYSTSGPLPHPPCPVSVVIMIGEENGNVGQASFVRSTWQRKAICRISQTPREVALDQPTLDIAHQRLPTWISPAFNAWHVPCRRSPVYTRSHTTRYLTMRPSSFRLKG